MKLAVILGTVREARHSDKVAKWAVSHASKLDGVEVELIDLKDYPMPFFDEAISPRYNPERKAVPAVQKWLNKIAEFDAYLFVTPEYNHSIPGVLKNALDYIDFQLKQKPSAIISHGSVGGARAAEQLKLILVEVLSPVIPPAVPLTMRVGDNFDENGTLSEEVANQPYGPQMALGGMLAELKWYSDALSTARAHA
jgi:NAD(P)H-dependent FMN reductase